MMHELLQSDRLIIQARFRILPRLTTRFNVIDDANKAIGTLIFHPAWSYPILWFFGVLLELSLLSGGIYLAVKQSGNPRYIGIGLAFFGLLMALMRFHSFLATRSPTKIELWDRDNKLVLASHKGWALFQPLFTIHDAKGDIVGQARQSLFWADRKYILWDDQSKRWGDIKRGFIGSRYTVQRNGKPVARMRKNLLDVRKLLGMRSFLVEFQESNLSAKERTLILGAITNTEVLTRQKKLREEPVPSPIAPTKS